MLGVNTGFPSRFAHTYNFTDFCEAELRHIFRSDVVKRGFSLPSPAECGVNVARVFAARLARSAGLKGFGNARWGGGLI